MILEGRFEYKKALILTPERIRELEGILLKYSERVSYVATNVADTEITFASVDELLSYDNFESRKIKSLTVIGRNGIDRIITCIFDANGFNILVGYSQTCICRYSVSSVDTETTLKEDVQNFLRKTTARFWLIGKFRLFGLLCVLALPAFLLMMTMTTSKIDYSGLNILYALVAMLLGFGLVETTRLIDRRILGKFFPPIVFLWGEEIKCYKKYDSSRKNIFWSVIVAVLVGIAVFYITDRLTS